MSVLRDVSIIFLAVEAFVLMFVPVAIFGGLVYGLWWLRRHENLPAWLKIVRVYFDRACEIAEMGMSVAVRPIYAIHSAVATVQGWLKVINRTGGKL